MGDDAKYTAHDRFLRLVLVARNNAFDGLRKGNPGLPAQIGLNPGGVVNNGVL